MRPKKCRAGWALVGMVCGAGAGKISQTPAGAEQGGFKFCGYGAGADTKFQPVQDSNIYCNKGRNKNFRCISTLNKAVIIFHQQKQATSYPLLCTD